MASAQGAFSYDAATWLASCRDDIEKLRLRTGWDTRESAFFRKQAFEC